MKLIIFGATGTVGKQVVLQALAMGHQVTAFARNPQNLEDIRHRDLHFYKGDVMDVNTVEKAIRGHDAVLCVLGAGRKGRIRSEGTANIIQAMQQAGVKHFICQSTLGAGDSSGNLNFFWKHIMFGWFLKEAYLDHQLQEEYVKRSNLDWVIVRPAAFTNGKLTGNYKHGFSSAEKNITLKISRADVAHFLLRQLTDRSYLHKTPGLSY